MISLLFFSISLLSSSLSLKIQTVKERAEDEAAPEAARVSFVQSSEASEGEPRAHFTQVPEGGVGRGALPWESVAIRDAIPLLSEREADFFAVLRGAMERVHCVAMAKVHLPTVTHGADLDAEAEENLRRARQALSNWEAQFVVCHGVSLKVMAVVRLTSPIVRHPLRMFMERKVDAALAGVEIPVVRFVEATDYLEGEIVAALLPHLT